MQGTLWSCGASMPGQYIGAETHVGVSPPSSVPFTSAPAAMQSTAQSLCPLWHAISSGEAPTWLHTVTSAPASSSSSTASASPRQQLMSRGVCPCGSCQSSTEDLFHLGLRLRTSHCCLKLAWSASRHAVKSLDIFEPALLFLPPQAARRRTDGVAPCLSRRRPILRQTSASSWRPSFVSSTLPAVKPLLQLKYQLCTSTNKTGRPFSSATCTHELVQPSPSDREMPRPRL